MTGAGGRLGRLLRAALAAAPVPGLVPFWVGRQQGLDLAWDMLSEPAPRWPEGAIILHLAGVVRGDAAALAANRALVAPLLSACRQNRAGGLLFASTAAVYAPGPRPASEATRPAPVSDYGRSKLAAEAELAAQGPGCPVCVLRLGNVVGADALLGPRAAEPVILLDPVPGSAGGPRRSWIGPLTLLRVIAALAGQMAGGTPLPPVLNLASPPPLAMADLLMASGRRWAYGPANPAVVPLAAMDTGLLQGIVPMPPASAATLIAELNRANVA